jgi:RimJ/RimL family protein N-acetyltransferase
MIDLRFERAHEADVPFIMATERMNGYDELVGRWDEARHLSAVNDRHYAYFLAKDIRGPVGFAIVRDWASPERVTCVKRIAVVKPGKRVGRRLLRAVVEAIFQGTNAYRVWLGVFPENERARRAYEAVGFRAEGIARGNAFFGGTFHDELIMAILKPEWEPAADSD